MTDKFDIVLFTDGASKGNPGSGGWGTVIIDQVHQKITELGGAEKNTTNNRMELTAILKGFEHLQSLSNDARILVLSDSQYSINGITKWVIGWQKNGWKTSAKGDVLNKDLWEKLVSLTQNKRIEWKYVEGHVGIPGNERVDVIASNYAEGIPVELHSGSADSYHTVDILKISDGKSGGVSKSAKAYSYISLVDGSVKSHKDWASCEKEVKGKKAKFKKVFSKEEEQKTMEEWGR
jgi:ribonuclease HI